MSVSKTRDEFVDKFCEDFVCSVCLCIPFPNHAIEATCCGSFFCYPCLQGCREKREVCPNCNGDYKESPPRSVREGNKFALKKLHGLTVYCDTKFLNDTTPDGEEPLDYGSAKCEWEGAWGDMVDHLKKCDFVNVSCLWNNCPRIIPRRVAEEHERVCNFRTVFCEFCATALPHNVMQKHQATDCEQFPIECECKEPSIVRSSYASHVSFDCPLALQSCQIDGCSEKVFRKDSQEHETNCIFREVTCSYCTGVLPFNKLSDHHNVDCECVLVGCPNNCGAETMQRKNLLVHDEECPTLPVVCMFDGCDTKVERRALATHMQEGIGYHFQIMYKQLSSLRSTVTSLTSTLSESTTKIETLTSQLAEKDKTIAEITKKQQTTSLNEVSLTTKVAAMEGKVKEIRSTPVSLMIHGPFYLTMYYATPTTFNASDVEWTVNITKAAKGPALYMGIKETKNGAIGAKISFTFTLFLDRGPVATSTTKLEITKAQSAGIYIETALPHAAPYRTAISDFKVNEFMW